MDTKGRPLPWWPRDFLADEHVQLMSLEEEGAYRRLLDHQWLHGSIPADLKQLAVICKGQTLRKMRGIFEKFAQCFALIGDGTRLQNPRMERVRAEVEAYTQRRVKAGQAGAATRWQTHSIAIDVPLANAWPPSPTPSPKKKLTTTTSSPSAPTDTAFEELWTAYPHPPGDSKADARVQYHARLREGVPHGVLLAGITAYARFVVQEGREAKYRMQARRFVGKGRHWEANWTAAAPTPKPADVSPLRRYVPPEGPMAPLRVSLASLAAQGKLPGYRPTLQEAS